MPTHAAHHFILTSSSSKLAVMWCCSAWLGIVERNARAETPWVFSPEAGASKARLSPSQTRLGDPRGILWPRGACTSFESVYHQTSG